MGTKLIGKGYWYNVYDIGNGRVRKIEKTFFQKVRDSFKQESRRPLVWLHSLCKLLTGRQKISSQYKYLENKTNTSLICSPKFLKGINYEQDKVQTLREIFVQSDDVQIRKLIDKYIENIILCWQNGFADKVFNFTENNGLSADGAVVLLDFNEITLSKEDVMHDIETKRWRKSWSASQFNQELQSYYFEQMDRKITPDSLNEYWKSSV